MTPRAAIYRESDVDYLWFWCVGCETNHRVPVTGPRKWGWNGSVERPTLTPSIKVTHTYHEPGQIDTRTCHSYVIDGRVEYLRDSTHALAGQTVDLEDAT